jgi:hypothetical protein
MWCPLDTIPAPDAEETQGALRFRHIRPVIVICLCAVSSFNSLPLCLSTLQSIIQSFHFHFLMELLMRTKGSFYDVGIQPLHY